MLFLPLAQHEPLLSLFLDTALACLGGLLFTVMLIQQAGGPTGPALLNLYHSICRYTAPCWSLMWSPGPLPHLCVCVCVFINVGLIFFHTETIGGSCVVEDHLFAVRKECPIMVAVSSVY